LRALKEVRCRSDFAAGSSGPGTNQVQAGNYHEDGEGASEELAIKTEYLKEKLAKLESEMQRLAAMEQQMLASPDQQISLTDPDSRSMARSGYFVRNNQVMLRIDRDLHIVTRRRPSRARSSRIRDILLEQERRSGSYN
jgi:hypothetical protein